MSLNIGLVGLPNVGKSTLFNALTKQNVLVADYPFATIEPNLGIVPLPDDRVEQLAQIFNSSKVLPATVSFVDIAGLVKGASQGEGLGNKFLSHIRQSSVIAQVIGAFRQSEDAANEIKVIQTELLLADHQTLITQLEKLKKPARSDPQIADLVHFIKLALEDIDNEILLSLSPHKKEYEQKFIQFSLLTLKPFIYIFNLSDDDLKNSKLKAELNQLVEGHCLFLSARLELELSQLNTQDLNLFLSEYGLQQSGIGQLASLSFEILNLQTFLTAGDKETKAWVIPKNCLAPLAAGVIHSDMQRGFIAAEIVNFNDLKRLKSWSKARQDGVCRTEGKNYQMQDGDVVEFKFNV